MGELTTRFPWEPEPVTLEDTARTVKLLQQDMQYAVLFTAVLVHSKHEALRMLVNTARGQIIPRGECKFKDGTAVEFQDVGMPQPGAPQMTVQELTAKIWDVARELGLELA